MTAARQNRSGRGTCIVVIGFVAALLFGHDNSEGGVNTWTSAGPGHEVLSLTPDPRDSSTIYAQTFAGSSSTSDGGVTWRPKAPSSSPHPARIYVDPFSSDILYCDTASGILRSNDKGATWTSLGSVAGWSYRDNPQGRFLLHPAIQGTVFAGIYEAVLRSSDRGDSWTWLGMGGGGDLTPLAVDPFISARIYVNASAVGLLRTAGDGVSWESCSVGLSGSATALVADSHHQGVLYVGTTAGLFKTVDGATSWQPAGAGLPTGPIAGLALDPAESSILYALVNGSCWVSHDGAMTWAELPVPLEDASALALGPGSPAALLVGDSRGRFIRSSDGGVAWGEKALLPVSGLSVWALAVDSRDPAHYYAGGEAGSSVSRDTCRSWSQTDLAAPGIVTIAPDPSTPLKALAVRFLKGIYKSDNGGGSWTLVKSGRFYGLAIDPTDASIAYAGSMGFGLWKSVDSGTTWTEVTTFPNTSLRSPTILAVAVRPDNPSWIAAGLMNGSTNLVTSTDGGSSWTPLQVGNASELVNLAWDPHHPGTLYGTSLSSGVFKITPTGAEAMNDGIPVDSRGQRVIYGLALDPTSPGVVYVGVSNVGVFKSRDGGLHWKQLGSGLEGLVTDEIVVDQANPSLIHAATSKGVFSFTQVPLTVSAATPGFGESSGGTEVAISGSAFTDGLTVSFGGVTATAVTVRGDSELTAVTPPHDPGKVDVTVAAPDGQTATLQGGFTYFAPVSLTLMPTALSLPVGAVATLTLALSSAHPADLAIGLSSSDPAFVAVVSQAVIPAGAVSAVVGVRGLKTGGPVTVSAALPAAVGGGSATALVRVTDAQYLVPSVAHNPGLGGSAWRSDIAVVNPGTEDASLTLTYTPTSGSARTQTATLAAGATTEWRNVLESLFGIGASESSQGVVKVDSDVPVSVSSRTYNQSSTGTFGQNYPALTTADALTSGEIGILPQLKKNAAFRTNVGIVNLGGAECSVRLRFFSAAGTQVGEKTLTAGVGRWTQQSDVFANVGAGTQEIAYATVEVLTANGLAWTYASVVDAATGDPTTVPVQRR